MRSKFNQRWLIVGMIWLIALSMTYWNCAQIHAVSMTRENSERLRKEIFFQRRNGEKFLQIQNQYASYFMPVASVKLGFESVRSPLHALAVRLGLRNVGIESHMAQATQEQVPFTVRMSGEYEKAMRFVSALFAYPCISVRHSRITVLNPKGEAEIEMELYFHFKIEPQGHIGQPSLQASALSSDRGVQTQ